MSRFVLITRHPSDCADLEALVKPSGITLRPYPVLRLEDVDDEIGWQTVMATANTNASERWLVLASPRAPSRFAEGCRRRGADHLLELPAAAVGTATAHAAAEAGFRVDLVGPGHGGGLAAQLVEHLEQPTTIIFACGRERRLELPKILEDADHTVLPVEVYRMRPTPPRELPPLGPSLDAVVLTSPRSAGLYLDGVGGMPLPCPHWALGPTTRDAAAALGIDCAIPQEPTMESLAEELCKT
jgi:uroporphyrinogen-III synthase